MKIERQNSERTRSTTINSRSSSSTTNTSTTTRNTEPVVSCFADHDRQVIAEYYCKTIRHDLTMQVARYLSELMNEGMEPGVILAAIQETGWAPRPSPQYLRAILQRCRDQGIYTMAQWDYRQAERQEAIEQANRARYAEWTSFPGKDDMLPF